MVLSRADARRGSKVSENILAYLHFKRVQNQLLWGELERKLIQNKTEKLTFKLEFVWAVTTASHPLRAQGSSKLSGWNWFLNQEVKRGALENNLKSVFSEVFCICRATEQLWVHMAQSHYPYMYLTRKVAQAFCGITQAVKAEQHRVPRQDQRRASLLQKPGLLKHLGLYQLDSFKL